MATPRPAARQAPSLGGAPPGRTPEGLGDLQGSPADTPRAQGRNSHSNRSPRQVSARGGRPRSERRPPQHRRPAAPPQAQATPPRSQRADPASRRGPVAALPPAARPGPPPPPPPPRPAPPLASPSWTGTPDLAPGAGSVLDRRPPSPPLGGGDGGPG